MSLPPAGWYPDPGASADTRWWDGTRWTEHTHTAERGPRTDDGVPLASWGQRVGAYLIDSIIVTLLGLPGSIPFQIEMQSRMQPLLDRMNARAAAGEPPDLGQFYRDWGHQAGTLLMLSLLVSLLAWVAYVAVCLRWKGRTVGMRSLGIGVRTVEPTQGPLPWGVIARRIGGQQGPLLLMLLPGLAFFFLGACIAALWGFLDSLWPLGDRRNQTLHDKIAGTVVVRRS